MKFVTNSVTLLELLNSHLNEVVITVGFWPSFKGAFFLPVNVLHAFHMSQPCFYYTATRDGSLLSGASSLGCLIALELFKVYKPLKSC